MPHLILPYLYSFFKVLYAVFRFCSFGHFFFGFVAFNAPQCPPHSLLAQFPLLITVYNVGAVVCAVLGKEKPTLFGEKGGEISNRLKNQILL